MKEFSRDNLFLSLCGLPCVLCPMKLGNHCPGCGGGPGNQSCPIARCSLAHDGVEFCFECVEYPCELYTEIDRYDSFISHQCQLDRLRRARDEGVTSVTDELLQRRKLLDELLEHYNDGRHKTIYTIATSLLPLDELNDLVAEIENHENFCACTTKEQATLLTEELSALAERHKVVLKLRKAPTISHDERTT